MHNKTLSTGVFLIVTLIALTFVNILAYIANRKPAALVAAILSFITANIVLYVLLRIKVG